MNKMLIRVIRYDNRQSSYHAVCRAKHNLTRSSAASCSSSQLLEGAQCAQDNENTESVSGGYPRMHSWPEDRGATNLGRFTCVLSLKSLEFSRYIESVKGYVTHVTCRELHNLWSRKQNELIGNSMLHSIPADLQPLICYKM